jgi:hypothetical protein
MLSAFSPRAASRSSIRVRSASSAGSRARRLVISAATFAASSWRRASFGDG